MKNVRTEILYVQHISAIKTSKNLNLEDCELQEIKMKFTEAKTINSERENCSYIKSMSIKIR
jgi:hypothetical protein